ncbi:hypothetical protein GCM10010270_11890 [Streptomyces violaceus]|nr:hypothetical protein GCM10010270_11890 [Streptomyces janthinus]
MRVPRTVDGELQQRMAFPAGRSKAARALQEGDEVLLCTTRGCFRNPTRDLERDLGRAIDRVSAVGPVRMDEPVVSRSNHLDIAMGTRTFPYLLRLDRLGDIPAADPKSRLRFMSARWTVRRPRVRRH